MPLLRPVSLAEAAALSPWPDRIAGKTPWTKPPRSRADLAREYDQDQYGDLPERWKTYSRRLQTGQRHPGAVLRFLDERRRAGYQDMLDNTSIYGTVDLEAYLVSAADQLYAADLRSFEASFRSFIIERVAATQAMVPFDAIVEAGCGNGINLFNLFVHLQPTLIAGNDLSPNGIKFLKQVCRDLGVPGRFEAGDYRDMNALSNVVPETRAWALLSVHAVQMVETLGVEWFEQLVRLERPPCVGIHFEPAVWDEELPFAQQCVRYAELNRYNMDFLESLRRAEGAGLLKIVRAEKRAIGVSAFAPTSLLVWIPRL